MKSTLRNYSVLFFLRSQINEVGLWVSAIAFFSQGKTSYFLKIFSDRISFLNWLQTKVGNIYSDLKAHHKQVFSFFPQPNLFNPPFFKSPTFYSPSFGLRILIIEQIKINSYGPESLPKSI